MSSLRLEVATGKSAGRAFEAELDAVRIGRAPTNDLVLDDVLVSGEHARISSDAESFVLEDLGSTNGTWVLRGAERFALDEGSRALTLQSGDRIALGGLDEQAVELRVELAPESDTLQVALVRPLAELGGSAALAASDDRLRLLIQALREVVSHDGVADVVSGIADAALLLVPRATHATVVLRQEAESGSGGSSGKAVGFVPVVTRVRG